MQAMMESESVADCLGCNSNVALWLKSLFLETDDGVQKLGTICPCREPGARKLLKSSIHWNKKIRHVPAASLSETVTLNQCSWRAEYAAALSDSDPPRSGRPSSHRPSPSPSLFAAAAHNEWSAQNEWSCNALNI
jgi:hypothetical protein